MANLHPELYVWLYHNWRADPQRAEELQALLTLLSSLEAQGLPDLRQAAHERRRRADDAGFRSAPPSVFGYVPRETLRQAEQVERLARKLCLLD